MGDGGANLSWSLSYLSRHICRASTPSPNALTAEGKRFFTAWNMTRQKGAKRTAMHYHSVNSRLESLITRAQQMMVRHESRMDVLSTGGNLNYLGQRLHRWNGDASSPQSALDSPTPTIDWVVR